MAIELKPTGKRIIVKRDPIQTETPAGIVIPESVAANAGRQKPQFATVTEVGPDVSVGSTSPIPSVSKGKRVIAVGDRVVFTTWAGVEIEHDGQQHLILLEEDVVAVLVNDLKPNKKK